MDAESGAAADENKPLQIFRIFQGIKLSYGTAQRVACQHDIAIAKILDVSPQPLYIALNAGARLALGVAGEIDNIGSGKVIRLVVPGFLAAA